MKNKPLKKFFIKDKKGESRFFIKDKKGESRFFIKDKKGILLSETLKIILAVVGIVLLALLAWGLYSLVTQGQTELERKQAKESLETLYSEIRKVESGVQNEAEFFLESPNNWWVIAWPYQNEPEKPIQCKNYCICICPLPDLGISIRDDSLKECDNLGVCKDVSKPIKTIYEAGALGLYAELIRSFVNSLGYDTTNVPIDIDGDLPLKAVLEDNKILVKKEKR